MKVFQLVATIFYIEQLVLGLVQIFLSNAFWQEVKVHTLGSSFKCAWKWEYMVLIR